MKLHLVNSAREKITKNIVWLLMKIIINLVFPKDYIIQQCYQRINPTMVYFHNIFRDEFNSTHN